MAPKKSDDVLMEGGEPNVRLYKVVDDERVYLTGRFKTEVEAREALAMAEAAAQSRRAAEKAAEKAKTAAQDAE